MVQISCSTEYFHCRRALDHSPEPPPPWKMLQGCWVNNYPCALTQILVLTCICQHIIKKCRLGQVKEFLFYLYEWQSFKSYRYTVTEICKILLMTVLRPLAKHLCSHAVVLCSLVIPLQSWLVSCIYCELSRCCVTHSNRFNSTGSHYWFLLALKYTDRGASEPSPQYLI